MSPLTPQQPLEFPHLLSIYLSTLPHPTPIKVGIPIPKLTSVFPRYAIYLEAHPEDPKGAILIPPTCTTAAGILSVLQYHGTDSSSPIDLTLVSAVQLWQTMFFFGHGRMERLERAIEHEIRSSLTLPEIREIWRMRDFPGMTKFIEVLVEMLWGLQERMILRLGMAKGAKDPGPGSLKWLEQGLRILRWVEGEKVFCGEINRVMGVRKEKKRGRVFVAPKLATVPE